MSSGGTAHSSGACLYSDAIESHGFGFCSWDAWLEGRGLVKAWKGLQGHLRRARTFIRDGTWDRLRGVSPRVTAPWEESWGERPTRVNGRAGHRAKHGRWLAAQEL
jgi:hypothetical protein